MSEAAPSYDVRTAHRRLLGALDMAIRQGLEHDIAETMWTLGGVNRAVYLIGGAAVYSLAGKTYFDDIAIVHDPFGRESFYDLHVFGEHGNWYHLTTQVQYGADANRQRESISNANENYVFTTIDGHIAYDDAVNYSAIVEQCTTFTPERTELAARIMEQQKLYTAKSPDDFTELLRLELPEL